MTETPRKQQSSGLAVFLLCVALVMAGMAFLVGGPAVFVRLWQWILAQIGT